MRLTAEQIAVLVPADGKFHNIQITQQELFVDGKKRAFSNGRDIDFSIHNRPLSEDELKALSLDVPRCITE